jgi:transposase
MDDTDEPVELVQRVAALDVGKAVLEACVRVPHETTPGRRCQEVRTSATTTGALLELADWLRAQQVTLVVMEATSTSWKPPFTCWKASSPAGWAGARQVKNVPGRPTTDRQDASWLAKVAERGRCRPSSCHPSRSVSSAT